MNYFHMISYFHNFYVLIESYLFGNILILGIITPTKK